MTKQEREKIFGMGYKARQHNVPLTGNPYRTGRQMNEWEAGWRQADKDRRK